MNQLALIANDLGINERTLRRAINQGTIRSSRPSPRKMRMALTELEYIRTSWRLLADIRQTLRTQKNVEFALLIGSFARGDATAVSDVDLVVRLRESNLDRTLDLEASMSTSIERDVDVIDWEAACSDSAMVEEMLTDGRVLVDRSNLWSRFTRSHRLVDASDATIDRIDAALAGIDGFLASQR